MIMFTHALSVFYLIKHVIFNKTVLRTFFINDHLVQLITENMNFIEMSYN